MNFLNMSFKVGRLFDIDIRIHIIFVLWIVFRLMGSGGDGRGELFFLAMLFFIVLVHEFGHCFGARSVGGNAHEIMLWPLGGLAFADAPMRPWNQFVTVAGGPLVNVIFCVLAGLFLLVTGANPEFGWNPLGSPVRIGAGSSMHVYVAIFYHVNYWLLAFNLLPMYPLDGGRLLQVLLWKFMGLRRATVLAAQIGLGGAFVAGVWGLQSGGGILFFIAIFGAFECWRTLQMVKMGMFEDWRFEAAYERPDRDSWFGRLKKRWSQPKRPRGRGPVNPNPGGWERKREAEVKDEAELDRILKKVHDQGIHSLSYIERQKLERATRERQRRERGE